MKTFAEWQQDPSRTLYLLDVRTREEFEKDRIAGARHAPGGQLVQAADEYVGVRNARVVLIDPERVRAVMTASWLNQMGWPDVYVLEGEEGLARESGPRKAAVSGFKPWTMVRRACEARCSTSRPACASAAGTFPARGGWCVHALPKPRRRSARQAPDSHLGGRRACASRRAGGVALCGRKRRYASSTAATPAGRARGRAGIERATTATDDVWYKPYDHGSDYEKHAREYLSWEVALVEQIKRDPTIRFRSY